MKSPRLRIRVASQAATILEAIIWVGPLSSVAAPVVPGMLCDGANPCPRPDPPEACVPCSPNEPETTACGWKDLFGTCHTPTGQLFQNKQLRSCRVTSLPGATCRESSLPCYILKDCVNRVALGLQSSSVMVVPCGYEGSRLATGATWRTACNTGVNLLPGPQGTKVWGTSLNRIAPPMGWGEL